jgi:tripartite-type tricarboxylate transporter receptor subunit TctC
MNNEVQLYLAGWGVGRSQVEAGRVRALALAASHRQPNIPLPTALESGVPNYIASNWWGLAAPQGTPQPVLNRIYLAMTAALADTSSSTSFRFLSAESALRCAIANSQVETAERPSKRSA